MDIGVALPQMAPDYAPDTTVRWSRGIDAGPFSSVSAGERVTFTNPRWSPAWWPPPRSPSGSGDGQRLGPPAAPPAMVAQQVGTLDQLSAPDPACLDALTALAARR